MILLWLILIPFLGGVFAWATSARSQNSARWVSLAANLLGFLLSVRLWLRSPTQGTWIVDFARPWIPQFGISFHLAVDGISLLLVVLTFFLGFVSVVASWTEIRDRVGLFHLVLLWTIAGVIGVFLALDLFLFYFFWELMLVPMYFLISIWGHENRTYAAIKFFLFTQACSLLLLVAIVALFFAHGASSGVYTFDYPKLLGTLPPPGTALWLMLGFFAAFAVKLPVVPLHTWLPDAHTEAPTAGSVLLAGIFLKTGAYGILRFVLPLFPSASMAFAPVAMALGVVGILYGAILAYAQTDMKRLVAYTSVSHLGFVLLGVFAKSPTALQGAVMVMICHALSTGALFVIVGAISERLHTRDLGRMGGLWKVAPRLSGAGLFFALATLGLPGLGNFVGEWLVLLGAFPQSHLLTSLAAVGLIASTIYSLWLVQKVFHGKPVVEISMPDLSGREAATLGILIIGLVWLGMYPQPILDLATTSLQSISRQAMMGAR